MQRVPRHTTVEKLEPMFGMINYNYAINIMNSLPRDGNIGYPYIIAVSPGNNTFII